MPNKSYLTQIQAIEGKVHQLVQQYQAGKERLLAAQQEIERLQQVIQEKDAEIKNFQNQDNISKIVQTIAVDTTNSTELKLKINEYLREIDKCIAYLRE
jgi:molecular chaperone GrpE (heat shock protein)